MIRADVPPMPAMLRSTIDLGGRILWVNAAVNEQRRAKRETAKLLGVSVKQLRKKQKAARRADRA